MAGLSWGKKRGGGGGGGGGEILFITFFLSGKKYNFFCDAFSFC